MKKLLLGLMFAALSYGQITTIPSGGSGSGSTITNNAAGQIATFDVDFNIGTTAFVANANNSIALWAPASAGLNIRGKCYAFTGEHTWTATITPRVPLSSNTSAGTQLGIGFVESATGKAVIYGIGSSGGTPGITASGTFWNSATSFAGSYTMDVDQIYQRGPIWIRIDRQATNRVVTISSDNFRDRYASHTIAKEHGATTDFDRFCVLYQSNKNVVGGFDLLSFLDE